MKWAAIVVMWSGGTRVALFPRETLSDNSDPTKCSKHFPLSLRSETQKTLGNSERFEGGISVVDMRMSWGWFHDDDVIKTSERCRGDVMRKSWGCHDDDVVLLSWWCHDDVMRLNSCQQREESRAWASPARKYLNNYVFSPGLTRILTFKKADGSYGAWIAIPSSYW